MASRLFMALLVIRLEKREVKVRRQPTKPWHKTGYWGAGGLREGEGEIERRRMEVVEVKVCRQ